MIYQQIKKQHSTKLNANIVMMSSNRNDSQQHRKKTQQTHRDINSKIVTGTAEVAEDRETARRTTDAAWRDDRHHEEEKTEEKAEKKVEKKDAKKETSKDEKDVKVLKSSDEAKKMIGAEGDGKDKTGGKETGSTKGGAQGVKRGIFQRKAT